MTRAAPLRAGRALRRGHPGKPARRGSDALDYFDEPLERIRDIRASERRVCLRVREKFALAADYDSQCAAVATFFQTIQNKLHFAATGMTAAQEDLPARDWQTRLDDFLRFTSATFWSTRGASARPTPMREPRPNTSDSRSGAEHCWKPRPSAPGSRRWRMRPGRSRRRSRSPVASRRGASREAPLRLDDFKRNPQQFIELAAEAINRCKRLALVDGLKYRRLGEEHLYAQELFETEELTGYFRNLVEVQRSVYEQVVYDSDTEKTFADQLEKNRAIKVYAKLPGWFTVPTPLGGYNPDWAVLVEECGCERLYFVVETKGSAFWTTCGTRGEPR